MYTATQTPTAVTVVAPRGSTPAGRRERDLEARLAVEGLLPWTHPPAFVGSGCVALRPLVIPLTLVILGRAHACACVQARASAAGVWPWSSGRAARLPPAGRRKRRLSVVCAPAAAGTSPPTSSQGHGGGGQALPRGRGDSSTLGGGSVYGGGAYRGGGSSPPACCRAAATPCRRLSVGGGFGGRLCGRHWVPRHRRGVSPSSLRGVLLGGGGRLGGSRRPSRGCQRPTSVRPVLC